MRPTRLADAAHLGRLDAYDLMMIEQPLDYDDVMDHVALQQRLKTPICLDESIHTVRIARDAIAAGACKIINIKPGRVGGHRESIRLHDLCAQHQIPVWHGGMLETGIGRAHNIHLASLPNFTLPGDIAASKRYYSPDLIEPAIDVARDGTIAVPAGPGIGVQIVPERVERGHAAVGRARSPVRDRWHEDESSAQIHRAALASGDAGRMRDTAAGAGPGRRRAATDVRAEDGVDSAARGRSHPRSRPSRHAPPPPPAVSPARASSARRGRAAAPTAPESADAVDRR